MSNSVDMSLLNEQTPSERPAPAMKRQTPIRILSLGRNQGCFIGPLYGEMKRLCPQLEFDVCDYFTFSDALDYNEKNTFSRFLSSPCVRRLRFGMISTLVRTLFSGHIFRNVTRAAICSGLSPLAILKAAAKSFRINCFAREVFGQQTYDICHFHYCTADSLQYIDVVPRSTKVICSFWGSDLLRHSGLEAYWSVSNALERADAITIQSIELREILLSKFGRHLRPKIHLCRFAVDASAYQQIVTLSRQGTLDMLQARQQMSLPADRVVVAVGHNGNPQNKHLEILAGLAGLPDDCKCRIVLLFPMTYGYQPSYAEAVEAACRRLGFEYRIFKEYLSREDLAKLRIVTDILIHMPESDALSGTALETIYAGKCLVAGGWLPYGPFRRLGLSFVEVEGYEQLTHVIPPLLDNHPLSDVGLHAIQERIAGSFLPDATTPAWIDVYLSLLQESQSQYSR